MKAKILGAWSVGVAVGFASAVVMLSSGCFMGAFAIEKAHAGSGTVVTEQCVKDAVGFGSYSATHTFDGMTPEELTGIRAAVDSGTTLVQQSLTFKGTTTIVGCSGGGGTAQRVIFVVP